MMEESFYLHFLAQFLTSIFFIPDPSLFFSGNGGGSTSTSLQPPTPSPASGFALPLRGPGTTSARPPFLREASQRPLPRKLWYQLCHWLSPLLGRKLVHFVDCFGGQLHPRLYRHDRRHSNIQVLLLCIKQNCLSRCWVTVNSKASPFNREKPIPRAP